MKHNLCIRGLFFLLLTYGGYGVASQGAPNIGLWARIKAMVGLEQAKTPTVTDIADTAGVAAVSGSLVTGAAAIGSFATSHPAMALRGGIYGGQTMAAAIVALKGAQEALKGIVHGDIISSLVGGVLLSGGLGFGLERSRMGGGIHPDEVTAILTIGAGAASLGIASAIIQQAYSYITTTTVQQPSEAPEVPQGRERVLIDTAKQAFSIALRDSDAFPTHQMQLNEVTKWLIMYQQDNTPRAKNNVKALEELKDNIQGSISFLQNLNATNPGIITSYDNAFANLVEWVRREITINKYILEFERVSHKPKFDIEVDIRDVSIEDARLWNKLKEELNALMNKEQFEQFSQETKTAYEYKAFKAFLKAANRDASLPVIWYEHEYEKIKKTTDSDKIRFWLTDIQDDLFYDMKSVEKARINVEKKLAYKELKNKTNKDKIRIYSTRMQDMSADTVEYKVYQEIIEELTQIPKAQLDLEELEQNWKKRLSAPGPRRISE